MIYLYTNTEAEKEFIMLNDQFFNLNTSNKPIGERERNAIWEIDHAKVTEDNMTYPERFDIPEEKQICFNNREIVTGRQGFEQWWSREYAGRDEK